MTADERQRAMLAICRAAIARKLPLPSYADLSGPLDCSSGHVGTVIRDLVASGSIVTKWMHIEKGYRGDGNKKRGPTRRQAMKHMENEERHAPSLFDAMAAD